MGTDLVDQWPLPDRPDLRDRLLAAYGATDRYYHDRRHLAEVLEHLADLMPADHPQRGAALLAAWYHDAVYDGRPDAEERSAGLAETDLCDVLAPGEVREVARLVRLTATHDPAPEDLAGQWLCDADLAILASGPERYADYVAGVRREYAGLGDAAFAAGRSAILAGLLGTASLYRTERGRERWESAARANLAAELAELRGRPR